MGGLSSVIFVQFSIILLAAIVHASLQCELGTLLLLYHASLGKHIKKTTKILVTNYILGAALLVFLLISSAAFLILTFSNGELPTFMLAILSMILFSLSVIICFFYYRTKRSTELWLPKAISRHITSRAKLTDSKIEAFSLGMLTAFSELPFSLVLVILAGNAILELPTLAQPFAIAAYTFITVLPLFVLRFSIRRGSTVVDIQKWRMKNKTFLKTISGLSFFALAFFLIAFKILGAKWV